MAKFLMVGMGGFLGSVMRYGAGLAVLKLPCANCSPLATLLVNATGCLLIGLLGGLAELRGFWGMEWKLFLLIGFLGGFTTFSAFGLESFEMLREGQWAMAAGNVFLQVSIGILAVWAGFLLSRLF